MAKVLLHIVPYQVSGDLGTQKVNVQVDENKIIEESAIYRYRSKLNEASFEICLENPALLKTPGNLELARQKVESDGGLQLLEE